MITIKAIKAEDTYNLRLKILKTCDEYQYKYQGDFNMNTVHFGAFKNVNLIGIVSLMKARNNSFIESQMQLRGMAIDIEYQEKNIGKFLIEQCNKHCKTNKIDLIWCNARELAIGFYKKQGFMIKGDSFHIKNVGRHFLMYKLI